MLLVCQKAILTRRRRLGSKNTSILNPVSSVSSVSSSPFFVLHGTKDVSCRRQLLQLQQQQRRRAVADTTRTDDWNTIERQQQQQRHHPHPHPHAPISFVHHYFIPPKIKIYQLTKWQQIISNRRPLFAVSFSSQPDYQRKNDEDPLISAKQLHEQRVALVQAKTQQLKQQKQQQQQQLQQQQQAKPLSDTSKEETRQENLRRHILANNIQHWFVKDSLFFEQTMQNLNLNPAAVAQITTNTNTNDSEEALDEAIQAVWKQYRQLYYDSLPSFRLLLEKEPHTLELDLDDVAKPLYKVGFGHAAWSKRFRNTRRRIVLQNTVRARLAKQQAEVSQRKVELESELERLHDLQEIHALLTKKRTIQEMYSPSRPSDQSSTKDTATWTTPKPDSSPSSSSPSFLAQALAAVTSYWTQPSREQHERVLDSNPPPSSSSAYPSQPQQHESSAEESTTSHVLPRHSTAQMRLERRIRRKENAIHTLQQSLNSSVEKLRQILQQQEQTQGATLPLEEYQHANQVLANVRPILAKTLANHIQQRHKELIEQYQTLDSKTGTFLLGSWGKKRRGLLFVLDGLFCVSVCLLCPQFMAFSSIDIFLTNHGTTDLTKPHEWYSYARLDRRKVRDDSRVFDANMFPPSVCLGFS